MRLAVHVTRIVVASIRYSIVNRQYAVAIVVLLGLVLLALSLTAQGVAPLALYPFA